MQRALLALVIAGCAEPRYEPLVCDPDRADEIAFGYQWVNDYIEYDVYKLHGRRFLLIDGSCRFWVAGVDDEGRLREGTLTSEELAAINEELLTGPFEAIDGVLDSPVGIDSASVFIWRDQLGGTCTDWCGRDGTLGRLAETADGWAERLRTRADRATGPLTVWPSPSSPLPGSTVVAWTGTDLHVLFAERATSALPIRVTSPDDVALLREIANDTPPFQVMFLSQGDETWSVVIADTTPFDDERGRVRPPFAAR